MQLAGSPDTLRSQLLQMIEHSGATELMLQSIFPDQDARRHSHALIAESLGIELVCNGAHSQPPSTHRAGQMAWRRQPAAQSDQVHVVPGTARTPSHDLHRGHLRAERRVQGGSGAGSTPVVRLAAGHARAGEAQLHRHAVPPPPSPLQRLLGGTLPPRASVLDYWN